jgi:hypothetical protein
MGKMSSYSDGDCGGSHGMSESHGMGPKMQAMHAKALRAAPVARLRQHADKIGNLPGPAPNMRDSTLKAHAKTKRTISNKTKGGESGWARWRAGGGGKGKSGGGKK